VAETSLTVPGIRYVIDAGTARMKRYSFRSKVEQLLVEPISQSSANQRAGRCGRVANGICIRLYDEKDFNGRPRFTDPEILRSSLAGVILRMKSLHMGLVEDFPFIERPSGRAIADGYQLLNELGAVDDANELTPMGQELAKLPLDPRVGRMILEARSRQSLDEVLVIAAATVIMKGIVIPSLLHRAMRTANIDRDLDPLIGFLPSLLLGAAGMIGAVVLAHRLPLLPEHRESLLVAGSLASVLTGLLLLIGRSKAISQVCGYLILENGIYLFGLLLIHSTPLLVEGGILLDLTVAVFVTGIIVDRIQRAFDSLDTRKLTVLRE